MHYGRFMYVFLITVMLLWGGIHWLTCKRFKIKNKIPYKHVNKTHKQAEILFLLVTLLGLLILFSTSHSIQPRCYIFLYLFVFSTVRAFMEWKFDKRSKRYIPSILAAVFLLIIFLGIEFVFNNPISVRLEAEQVEEIVLEQYLESKKQEEIVLSDKASFDPILNAVSNGSYEMERLRYQDPNQKMIIRLKNGSKIVIDKFKPFKSAVFIVHTERMFFPKDMIMQSPELERIFENYCRPNRVK